ncbi:dTMP kinase [Sedimenticola thiotaurini]|uniref:dTMP kinase n=1 Tax=Sedimenticola thiotaurini TaxID=1543721 RepID=UPI00069B8E36|nr:AAA family ATPase [Sedimenticola thiotaurini]
MGYFIAVEGLDGIGKSTLVEQLAREFSGLAMSTPGEALHDSRRVIMNDFSDDELAKALFYAASVSSQGRKARKKVESGKWVFMDRYWASTIAYAKARGVTAELDQLSKSLIQPDLSVLLILNESERQRRLHARGTTVEDIDTLDPGFRQCVLEELQTHANLVVNISGYDLLAATQMLEKVIRKKVKSTKSFGRA